MPSTGPPKTTEQQIREMNDALLVSMVRQHEAAEQSQKAEARQAVLSRELQHQFDRLRFMAESMPQKIFTAKPNGDVDYFNQQWMDFTGLTFEQIRDWGWLQFIHPDDREENIRRWQHSIDSGEDFELEHRFRRHDGRYRWHLSRAQAMRDAEGNVVVWMGSNTEIDDQKHNEVVLRESEERYRSLFASAPMAIFACDRNAVLQQYNDRAVAIWGREPELGVEKHCGSTKLWLPDGTLLPHANSPIMAVLCTGTAVQNVEVAIERPDGSRVPVLVNFAPMKNTQGEVIGAITAFADITDKKRAEEYQHLLNRELQHRTKNLLAVIRSIAQRSLTNGRSIKESQQVFSARLHALAHSNDVLMDANWEGASLRELISRVLDTFATRYSIEGGQVRLDPNATQGFALVLHELCTNASKYGAFSTPAGRVAIRWSIDEAGEEPTLTFRWQERGGPRVIAPAHKSFGTTLIERAIGAVKTPPRIDYAPEGLTYEFNVPLAAVAADVPFISPRDIFEQATRKSR